MIVLDEAQTLLLHPCLAALDQLARNYSAVLCMATQPALRVQDDLEGGLDIPPSLVGDTTNFSCNRRR